MGMVYISGKVSDLSLIEVVTKFHKAEVWLKNRAHTPINPLEKAAYNDYDKDDMAFSKRAVCAMMQCSIIAFLPCWKNCRRSYLEFELARVLGYHIIWLEASDL